MNGGDMNIETRVESMATIVELIKLTLDAGVPYTLPHPKGRSMYPVIITETDSVVLDKPTDLKKYDAVLYRRKSGAYVLHRIIGIRGDTLTICGDNQLNAEKIHRDQVIAKLTAILREENGEVRTIPSDDAPLQKQIKDIYRGHMPIIVYHRIRHAIAVPVKKILHPGKGAKK